MHNVLHDSDRYFLSEASIDDLLGIRKIHAESRLFNYPKVLFKFLIKRKWIYVVKTDKHVLGYLSFIPFSSYVFVLQVAIKSDYRNKGIGSFLMNYFIEVMKQRNINSFWAHTLKPRIVRFLNQQGWGLVARFLNVHLLNRNL